MRLTRLHDCTYLWHMNDLMKPIDVEAEAAKRGKSMAQVCREAGIAPSTYSRWKAGDTEPTLSVYRRIVAAVTQATA